MASPIPVVSEGFKAQCQGIALELAASPEVRTFTLIKGNAKAAKTFAEHKLREQTVKIQELVKKWPFKSARDLWSSDALEGLQEALRSLNITCVKAPKAKTVEFKEKLCVTFNNEEEFSNFDKTQQTTASLDEFSKDFKSYVQNYKLSSDHEALELTLTGLDKAAQVGILSSQLEEEVARTKAYIETFFKDIADKSIHSDTLKALDDALLRSGYMLEKYQMNKEELLNKLVEELLLINPHSKIEDIARLLTECLHSSKVGDIYNADNCTGTTPTITQYIKSLIQEHQTADEIKQAMARDLLSIIDRLTK